MKRVLLIADDLTGALDSGVAFASSEARVLVARSPSGVHALSTELPDVLIVNTATRDGTADEATAMMEALCGQIDLGGFDVVMKKVDSRLKGHVGAEVAVLADAIGAPSLVAAPAIPSMGRTQQGGVIRGQGIDGQIAIAPLFDRAVDCPDIASEADLDRIVAGRRPFLWVGARALAFALSRSIGTTMAPLAPNLPGPVLVAVGSRDPITVAQVEVLRRSWRVLAVPDGDLLGDVEEGEPIILHMTAGGAGRPPNEAAIAFARTVADTMRRNRPATLIASGGETANAILGALGVDRLVLIAEIAPGLPVSDARTEWGTLRVVTKSGGFGGPDALADLVRGRTEALEVRVT